MQHLGVHHSDFIYDLKRIMCVFCLRLEKHPSRITLFQKSATTRQLEASPFRFQWLRCFDNVYAWLLWPWIELLLKNRARKSTANRDCGSRFLNTRRLVAGQMISRFVIYRLISFVWPGFLFVSDSENTAGKRCVQAVYQRWNPFGMNIMIFIVKSIALQSYSAKHLSLQVRDTVEMSLLCATHDLPQVGAMVVISSNQVILNFRSHKHI